MDTTSTKSWAAATAGKVASVLGVSPAKVQGMTGGEGMGRESSSGNMPKSCGKSRFVPADAIWQQRHARSRATTAYSLAAMVARVVLGDLYSFCPPSSLKLLF
ncbi:hypothetical protein Nepgr_018963 [Nepenthes gracilis]|uniref:Uncharacterized protein n=1 Tax=Nepenthes gracilis TaxID=150966 RepID=A0AAD3SU59_NEPGR|nr:hypothetical protein Nepgr_018963 [Nepenthes gracilis]